ncbi:hypothetical protein CJ030_MR6G013925 [Morella rubra]|uniref:Uncharacterized protein n=1 Tax=Morella rubra TaxID=262757 RepID=A0A6A1VG96_9ROSI|nr:hypothetical protein CJ030_MR6G013925 [Morella rubra]
MGKPIAAARNPIESMQRMLREKLPNSNHPIFRQPASTRFQADAFYSIVHLHLESRWLVLLKCSRY